MTLTEADWKALFPRAPRAVIEAFAEKAAVLDATGVTGSKTRLAYFVANVAHECGGFTIPRLTENINYTAARMAAVWPNRFSSASDVVSKYGRGKGWQQKAFDDIYGGRMGNRKGTSDGSHFIGRGGPQVTGRDGYQEVGDRAGLDLVNGPETAAQLDLQPEICAAFWSWKDMNRHADAGNFTACVKAWNGGTNGMADRKRLLKDAQGVIDRLGIVPAMPVTSIASSVPTAPAPVVAEKPGIWAILWRAARGKDAAVETKAEVARPGLRATGEAALYDQQAMLSRKGYVEVGQPDGLMGHRTAAAIRAFRAENGLPASEAIDAKFSAALIAAGQRQVSAARAEATAGDLRAQGNQQIQQLDGIGWLGKALGLGGLVGGLNQSGVLDTANDTLQQAQGALSQITTVVTTIIGVVQWCVSHWWMFAIGGGVYVVFRVATAILNVVVLFRRGILARADK